MKLSKLISSRLFSAVAALAMVTVLVGSACAYSEMNTDPQPAGQSSDPRKNTSIQTATLDVNGTKNAVEVRYLNFPWGAETFGYIEKGGNQYYSTRTWPFAHLKLAKAAEFQGKSLAPGDYVLYITPKSAEKDMMLTVAAFTPTGNETFLKPGNVFTETPTDVREVVTIPAKFDTGDPVAENMMIKLEPTAGGATLVVHYGNRWLKEKFAIK